MTGSVLEQNQAEEGGEVPISDLNTNTMAAAPRVWANCLCEKDEREKVGRPATMSA